MTRASRSLIRTETGYREALALRDVPITLRTVPPSVNPCKPRTMPVDKEAA